MPIVDAHAHASPLWYEPVETLLYQMDANGVDQACLVQVLGQYDNTYQYDCVRRYPGRFANIVLVDPARPDATDTLKRQADTGASGIRLRLPDRSPGADPLAFWRTAAALDLTVSCLGRSFADFCDPDFAALVETLPTLRIVIEHLGGFNRPETTDAERADRQRVFAYAKYPNVYMKIHGLGEFCEPMQPRQGPFPFVRPIPAYLDQVYTLFGPERLMWGSDFPPVAAREGYASALRLCRDHFADKPEADRALIFGGVAARLFPIR